MERPTIRSLARALGLSRSTISDALRRSPRVNADTIRRVCAFAEAAGYRPNPLASAVMSQVRRSHADTFRGVLAVVSQDEPDRPESGRRFIQEITAGVESRAAELGFRAEPFLVGGRGLSLRRLDTILQSRGIEGIILLPTWGEPDFRGLDWSRYAGVYTDYFIEHPRLPSVCPDHHRSMTLAAHRLRTLGYRRPGLFLNAHQDERLHYRWEGAFLAFQRHTEGVAPVPPLLPGTVTSNVFKTWFRRHRPDVVIGHMTEAIEWMQDCGARVPQTHGFFSINLEMSGGHCAGIDQQPRLVGARAVEIVVAQLHRNERGIPEHVALTTIPGLWVAGPTVREVGDNLDQPGRCAVRATVAR